MRIGMLAIWFIKDTMKILSSLGWGMTELAPAGIIAEVDDAHPGSCGKVCINSEAKVVDVETARPQREGRARHQRASGKLLQMLPTCHVAEMLLGK